MRAEQRKIRSADDPIPFPRQREILTELREIDNHLRSLREKVESGAETASAARTVALLYVDFIARVHAFSAQFDTALDSQLFLPDGPFRENVMRARAVLSIYERVIKMTLEATKGLFNCLGGEKLITLQAIARWVVQDPEARTAISAVEQQIQRIARRLEKLSK